MKGNRVGKSPGHIFNNVATLQSSTMWKLEERFAWLKKAVFC